MASLAMLSSRENWNERNAGFFVEHETYAGQIICKIKFESSNWEVAGAKHLSLSCHASKIFYFLCHFTLASICNLLSINEMRHIKMHPPQN
jgi:hypothetical protein